MAVDLSGFSGQLSNVNFSPGYQQAGAGQLQQNVAPAMSNFNGAAVVGTSPQTGAVQQATTSTPAPAAPSGGGGGSSSGGGGYIDPHPGGFGSASSPDLSNSYKQNLYNQYLASLGQSASQTSQAQIDAAVAQYNQMRANLEAQRQPLQDAFNQANQTIDSSIAQNKTQADYQTNLLNSGMQNGINTANQNYLQLQAQNRGVARAYGGFGSDFEESQNRAGQNFGNTVAGIQSDTTNRINDVQQNFAGYMQQAQAQKAQLGSQLEQGMRQIALDEYATDQQKAAAIGQIQAQYADHIASINQSILTFQQQFALAQQQAQTYLAAYGKSTKGFDPMGTANGLLNAQPLSINSNNNGQASGGLFFPTQNNDKFPTING